MNEVEVVAALSRTERTVALLDRVRPTNFADELRRLEAAWGRGDATVPQFAYAPAPDLSELRRALSDLARQIEPEGALGEEYAARARELSLEAELAEQIATSGFGARAELRFSAGDDLDSRAAADWAASWATEVADPAGPRSVSDDERDPTSLICLLRGRVGELRLPFRVEPTPGLVSVAATAQGVIRVATGIELDVQRAQRILLHEIEGHAAPRARGSVSGLGLNVVGSAQGSDDEEGRALHVERAAGLLDARRRAELGYRHLASLALRRGASFVEVVRDLGQRGARGSLALRVAARAFRGGGLAREIVYLPALSRVARALDEEPELEAVLGAGRVSVRAARTVLRAARHGTWS